MLYYIILSLTILGCFVFSSPVNTATVTIIPAGIAIHKGNSVQIAQGITGRGAFYTYPSTSMENY